MRTTSHALKDPPKSSSVAVEREWLNIVNILSRCRQLHNQTVVPSDFGSVIKTGKIAQESLGRMGGQEGAERDAPTLQLNGLYSTNLLGRADRTSVERFVLGRISL